MRLIVAVVATLLAACTAAVTPEPPGGTVRTLRLSTGDIPLDAGTERTECLYFNLPSDEPLEVIGFAQTARGYNHHFVLFTGGAPHPAGWGSCPTNLVLDGSVPIYPGTREVGSFRFPDGVALPIAARQPMILQMHLLNASTSPGVENMSIDLMLGDPEVVYIRAGIMGGRDDNFRIPANSTHTETQRCFSLSDVNLFLFTSHAHRRNTLFTISTVEAGVPREVYRSIDWADPAVTGYAPPIHVPQNGELEFACTWQNDDPYDVVNGGLADDEMCIFYGYYYPATIGLTFCVGS